ncbi:hypothetical protein PROFUN_11436, partial [Planoprotostelium fungivorum]
HANRKRESRCSHPRSHKQGCDWSKKSAALDFIRTVATDEQVSDWTSYDKAQLVSAVNAKGPAQGASPSGPLWGSTGLSGSNSHSSGSTGGFRQRSRDQKIHENLLWSLNHLQENRGIKDRVWLKNVVNNLSLDAIDLMPSPRRTDTTSLLEFLDKFWDNGKRKAAKFSTQYIEQSVLPVDSLEEQTVDSTWELAVLVYNIATFVFKQTALEGWTNTWATRLTWRISTAAAIWRLNEAENAELALHRTGLSN